MLLESFYVVCTSIHVDIGIYFHNLASFWTAVNSKYLVGMPERKPNFFGFFFQNDFVIEYNYIKQFCEILVFPVKTPLILNDDHWDGVGKAGEPY